MIRLRYDLVRWVIAVLTLILVILAVAIRPTGGALIFFVLLLLTSSGAIVYPPGVYGWLIQPVCLRCGKRGHWAIEQGHTNPYVEELVFRCPDCATERVEFHFDPT